jgi:lysophospholipase L1-like esterase
MALVYTPYQLTGLSVAVALLIGTIEWLQISIGALHLRGRLADFVSGLEMGALGYLVVGLFFVAWGVSVTVWKFGRFGERGRRQSVHAKSAMACLAILAFAVLAPPLSALADTGSTAADHPAGKVIHIVALGDSTTAPYDWAPQVKRVYASCLPETLAIHGIHVEVVNAGIGDTTTAQALARLDRDVRSHKPDVVIVQFGINDSWIDADEGKTLPRLTRTQYGDNLRTIIGILRRDGAQPVLMTPNSMRWLDPYYIRVFQEHPGLLDTRASRGIDKLLDVYAEDVRSVAHEQSVPLVDIFAAFEDRDKITGHSINEILLEGDGIHPNQAGQDLVCSLLSKRLLELLSPRAR